MQGKDCKVHTGAVLTDKARKRGVDSSTCSHPLIDKATN